MSNISWAGEADDRYLRLLSELKVQGLEIAASLIWPEPTEATPRQRRDYRELVSSHGLEICGLASLLFSQPDLQLLSEGIEKQRLIDYLRGTIDLCSDLGGRYLVFGRPQNRRRNELPKSIALERATAVFKELGHHARDRECFIGIEPLPFPGCDFITSLSEAVELVTVVDSSGVRLHFDTGAAEGANEQTLDVESLDALISCAASCQINDHELLSPGANGHSLHEIWACSLTSAQYSGWLTIEMRKPDNRSPIDAIRDAVSFTRAAYESVLSPQAKNI